jgi:hypothetical protein
MNTLLIVTKTPPGFRWDSDEVLNQAIAEENNRLASSSALTIQALSNDSLELVAKSNDPENVFASVKKIVDLIFARAN